MEVVCEFEVQKSLEFFIEGISFEFQCVEEGDMSDFLGQLVDGVIFEVEYFQFE